MSNVFSLSDIRAAAEKKFADQHAELANGETVTLKNPIRLTVEERKAFAALSDNDGDNDRDVSTFALEAFTLLAGARAAKAILRDYKVDGALVLLERYTEATSAGE
ncbi:hypothetical protein EV193_104367 [Herbihabitans rhizosphaerae]|uniref:Tail assembly chaperone n=1 Tax=Herbihabitans rhizosphaerae TaxID=1872711 RepID=A0A4Q7KTK2_9PSEU|nr:phage tail assembly protein [Herbihabitans rhizosphaerae]RZS39151.1 hypothetical protein EV193_104367 [Herbihabitans rhizosphaerae]